MLEALTARGLAPNKVDQVLGRMAQYSDKITGAANVDG
jgi:hemoglobin